MAARKLILGTVTVVGYILKILAYLSQYSLNTSIFLDTLFYLTRRKQTCSTKKIKSIQKSAYFHF